MFAVLRRVGLFGGIDGIRLDPLLLHKRFNAFAPDVPAVRIRLHALFIKGMNADVFLVFKRLQQPAQTVADGRLLRHRALFKQRAVALFVIAHDDMQLIDLATGALDQIDMAGMQRIKLAKDDADALLTARKLQPQKTVQRFKLLRARAFDFGVEKLA